MKRNGFTLIELLAVIVILAIIALIAVPIILNIIGDAKKESLERSKELYIDAVENAIVKENFTSEFNPTTCTVKSDGNLTCKNGESNVELIVEVNGTKPCGGSITLDNGKVKESNLSYCDGSDESQDDKEYVDSSGANAPELMDSLTPIVYKTDHWEIADTTSEWYNYESQEWANAVILSDSGKSKTEPGTTINVETDVKAMLVWIPRYEYKIDTTDGQFGKGSTNKNLPGEIEVNFIAKDTTGATEGYTVHPAFNFGGTQLSGIWVGKFETTGNGDNPTILPNQESLKNQNVSTQFATAQKFNDSLKSNGDSHMAKNSEWGAVAYLSQSKYGKYGNGAYTGANKEVYINNCSSYITGIGADEVSASYSASTCTTPQNKYDGTSGVKASTTGNIYGVYDMSGGAWEYVMGYLTTANLSKWGSTSSTDYAKFASQPDSKYFDAYTDTDKNNVAYKGHALGETSGWYGDYANFVSTSNPWFIRGGRYDGTSSAGVFYFNFYDGYRYSNNSFRVVFAPTT